MLVFVATQTIPVSLILAWIDMHVDLVHDFVLEHNGHAVQVAQMITFAPGDVFILRTVPADRILDASTSQGHPLASSSDSHGSGDGQAIPLEHLSLLQFSCTLKASRMLQGSVKSLARNSVSFGTNKVGHWSPFWFLSPVAGLQPPGNPTIWGGADFQAMDTYYKHRDLFLVVDVPYRGCMQFGSPPAQVQMCKGRVISIADAVLQAPESSREPRVHAP